MPSARVLVTLPLRPFLLSLVPPAALTSKQALRAVVVVLGSVSTGRSIAPELVCSILKKVKTDLENLYAF